MFDSNNATANSGILLMIFVLTSRDLQSPSPIRRVSSQKMIDSSPADPSLVISLEMTNGVNAVLTTDFSVSKSIPFSEITNPSGLSKIAMLSGASGKTSPIVPLISPKIFRRTTGELRIAIGECFPA